MTRLGPDVPLHFTAFHPDDKMLGLPCTPASTLTKARDVAREVGLNFVYTANVHNAGLDHHAHNRTQLVNC
jgi:pyruvate formate lyase activating enzyme